MAGLFRIESAGVAASPDSRLIKAAEWAEYLTAGEIVAAAERRAANLRREAKKAFAEEKRKGYEEGMLQSRREHSEHMMETVLKSIEYLDGLEKGVAGLVGDALRKILDEIPPEERIVRVARQALNLVRGQKKVTLTVCPEDEAVLRSRLDAIAGSHPSIDFIEVAADGRLSPGSCLLQSDMGVVDASLETQIQAVVNALERSRKG
jgi:type III secretion protein L